jgi:hypothetical protein
MVEFTGVGSCTLTASQDGDEKFNAAQSVSRSFFIVNDGETVLDLSAFGANGDGSTDNGPAFQQALDALAGAGGGTLFVPPGRHALVTPVTGNFTGLASAIAIRGVESDTVVNVDVDGYLVVSGLDLSSEVYPRTGEQVAISITGLKQFLVSDVAFVGTAGIDTDAMATLHFFEVDDATIHHCEFYGLRTMVPGAGIVLAHRSGLRVEQTKFLGSFGHSAVNTPVVQNLEWKGIVFSDVAFTDYGLRPELYCKCENATYSWITVGNAAAITADSPRREASFRNVFMDEGGFVGLFSLPEFFQPPGPLIDLIYISGLHMNVSNLGTTGNYLSGIQRGMIENAKYGWSQNAGSAIELLDAGNVIIDQAECTDSADRIHADSATQRVTVINSIYASLDSQAQITRTLSVAPEEDPVQFVRTQFEQIAGRAPDPAAHFYWSDLLLQCGDDPQCVDQRRDELASYLQTAPSPDFSINGQIKDEQGAPLAGVIVTLSGSQSVTSQTDSEGRYAFGALPTSGVYSITPARSHYTFADPSRTIITPANDQTIDFGAIHNRYQISGRVLDGAGQGLGQVSVELSGSGSEVTTSDVDGNYVFLAEAEGNYTVTISKTHYLFSPAETTLNNLTGNEIRNFSGNLVSYVVSGQVKSNGVGLSGVTVAVSGAQAATTTTDSSGNFSFQLTAEGNYTLTPAKTHHTFSPGSLSFDHLAGNSNANFTGTRLNYILSGKISENGIGLKGVLVTLSGSQSGSITTDSGGDYAFTVPSEGNYSVTPTLSHYTFSPAQSTYTNLGGDNAAAFAATLNRHAISGKVTNATGGALPNVTVSLSGAETGTTLTDNAGNFAFVNLPAGKDYSVTVTKQNYSFISPTQTFNGISSDQIATFSGSLVSYTISGQVIAEGKALDGALITLSGSQPGTITTNSTGKYSFTVTAEGNYTVAVSKTHYTFSPQSTNFTSLARNESADFGATVNRHAISGRVTTETGAAIKSVTIALSGPESRLTTTDANGNFAFNNLAAGGTYTVTPSLTGYEFSPPEKVLVDLSSDQNVGLVGFLLPQLLLDATGEDSNCAVALDSLLLVSGPFSVQSLADWLNVGSDKNTRLLIFAANVNLNTNEGPSAVMVKLVDGNGQNHEVYAEDVRLLPNSTLAQITFRLPDGLADGTSAISIRFHSLNSNLGTVRIASK